MLEKLFSMFSQLILITVNVVLILETKEKSIRFYLLYFRKQYDSSKLIRIAFNNI